jgi:TonB family protein
MMRQRIHIALTVLALGLVLTLKGQEQMEGHLYHYNVDNFPEVYGGREEWKRFLRDHMVYPPADLKAKKEGAVKIYFVVTSEGRAVNAKVTQGVSEEVDREALRLLRLLEWMPSYQDEKAVNVAHSVEIEFSPSRYRKWVKQRGYAIAAFTDLPPDTGFAVHETSEKAPAFADPEKTFPEFVAGTLEYPEAAKQQGLQGSITLSFIIEPDGRTSNIRIKKGVGGGCNEEAIRVVGLSKWRPAQKGGKYVRFRMYYTMVFSLQNNFRDNSSGTQRVGGQ